MDDLVGVAEAAYELSQPSPEWLQSVVDAARPALDQGRGLFAAEYDATDASNMRLSHVATSGMSSLGKNLLKLGVQTVGAEIISRLRHEPCGTLSEKLGKKTLSAIPLLKAAGFTFGTKDLVGVNAGDPTLRGIGFCAPSRELKTVDDAFRARWQRLAAHVAAALRLRRQVEQLGDPMEGVEAVLDPGGKLEHAQGVAEQKAYRAALRGAALAIDKARSAKLRRSDPDEALRIWGALVQGRWSLVDHFDKDGRRYLVARKNDPYVNGTVLTLRERQVLGFVCMGHPNKLVAYELGLATATVGVLLSTAMRKLGASSRVELIRRFRDGELSL